MKYLKHTTIGCVVGLISLASAAQAAVYPATQCRVLNGAAAPTGSGGMENAAGAASNLLCPIARVAGANFAVGSTVTVVDPSPADNVQCQLRAVSGNAAGGYAIVGTPSQNTAGFANTWQVLTFPALAVGASAAATFSCQLPPAGGGVSAKMLSYSTP